MATPYIGEIRIFAGNFAPLDWALCNGATLPIDQYQALFSLIGTTYGGDGVNTFQLPNLQSRLPVHVGSGFTQGQTAGEEDVTVTTQQLPAHTHLVSASSTTGGQTSPAGNVLAGSSTVSLYNANAPNQSLNPQMVGFAGGSQPHDNMQPFLVITFIIALFGVFPTQS